MESDLQLSLQQIVTILENPTSSYHFVTNYGNKPQILPHLIQILIRPDYKFKHALRIQAAILIRNGIDSWYSKYSPNQIENKFKIELGQTLLENVLEKGESNSVVQKQVALCMGKIGKSNLDSNLSNLIDGLLVRTRNIVSSGDWLTDSKKQFILNGYLEGFYRIIQNLISNRSSRGQLLLREVASTHFSHIHDIYSASFSSGTQVWQQMRTTSWNSSSITCYHQFIKLSRTCLKILSQMSTYAWKEPHTQELPTNFLMQCVVQWTEFLKIRQALAASISQNHLFMNDPSTRESWQSFLDLFHKHLYKFGKFTIQILNQDPHYLEFADFSNLLQQTVWQMVDQGSRMIDQDLMNSQPNTLAIYPEKVLIQSLRIMSLWITNQQISSSMTAIQSTELAMTILQRLLLLPPHSLRFWNEDPESYDNEEENSLENRSFDVRSCAANVLTLLLSCYPHEITNVILQMFSDLHSRDLNALPILLQLESTYFAIGLAAHHLAQPSSGFDLGEWITRNCMPVLCQLERSGVILRRRIAWALGQFSKQDLDVKLQSHVYAALSCLLENPNNDLAVEIATCRAIKATSNWEPAPSEEANVILPHLATFIKQISHLLSSVENLESQKILTDTLRLVIEKARSNILPYAIQLSSIMASLWHKVAESPSKANIGNHLHNTILVTMSSLVEAIGPISQEFHETIASFVQYSVDSNNPSSVYLQEDGLILWLTMMRQTEIMTPHLAKMLVALATLIQNATDSLGILLKILESYLLLDYQLVFSSAGSLLSINISQLLSTSMELAPTKAVLHSIECMVKCAESSLWQAWLEQSDCFSRLIQRAISTQDSVLIVVKHLLTICQLIVAEASSFYNLVGSLNREGISPADVLSSFCHTCFDKIDNVSTAQERKLIAAALACLVGNPNPIVLGKLADFISIWSSVLAEGDEILDDKTSTYRYSHEPHDINEYEFVEAGAEAKRIKQLLSRDPVKTKTLDRIISESIAAGGQQVMASLNNLDSFSVNELQQRLTGNLKG